MKKLSLFILHFVLVAPVAMAQADPEPSWDVKAGLGAILLFANENSIRHDIMVTGTEGEILMKLNKAVSTSATVNFGYGQRTSIVSADVRFKAFVTQLNGNIFLSPFGNHRRYNMQLGTGASVMFVSDRFTGAAVEHDKPETVLTTGLNLIFENEFLVGKRASVGLKTMAQAYASGDIAGSLLFKYGLRL